MIQPIWRFLKKLKIELPYEPAIPLLGIYPEKTIIHKKKFIKTNGFYKGIALRSTWLKCIDYTKWRVIAFEGLEWQPVCFRNTLLVCKTETN